MKQLGRFLVVGVCNTALGYGIIFGLMYGINLTPETSNAAGYSICLIISYILNRKFTFKSKQTWRGELVKFLTVFIIAYAVNFVVLVALTRGINLHSGISQIIAGAAYVMSSYFLNKLFVFKNHLANSKESFNQ